MENKVIAQVCAAINRRIMSMNYQQQKSVMEYLEAQEFIVESDVNEIANILDVNTNCIFDILTDLGLLKGGEQSDKPTLPTYEQWRSMGYEKANEILSKMTLLERLEALQGAPTEMTPYKYWLKKSKAQLMGWYMNALCTCSCIGHTKGRMNDEAVEEYLQLMKKYEIPVPPNEISYVLGEFNGEGSR